MGSQCLREAFCRWPDLLHSTGATSTGAGKEMSVSGAFGARCALQEQPLMLILSWQRQQYLSECSAVSGGQPSVCLEEPCSCCQSRATLNATTLKGLQAGPAGVSKAEFRLHFSVLLPALGAVTSFGKWLFTSCRITLDRSRVCKKVKISGDD